MVKWRRYVSCPRRSGGMADARDLKSREAHTSYRFESGLRYNESPVVMRTRGFLNCPEMPGIFLKIHHISLAYSVQ